MLASPVTLMARLLGSTAPAAWPGRVQMAGMSLIFNYRNSSLNAQAGGIEVIGPRERTHAPREQVAGMQIIGPRVRTHSSRAAMSGLAIIRDYETSALIGQMAGLDVIGIREKTYDTHGQLIASEIAGRLRTLNVRANQASLEVTGKYPAFRANISAVGIGIAHKLATISNRLAACGLEIVGVEA